MKRTILVGSGSSAHTHPESDVTSLTGDLANKAAKASNLSDLASAATARTNLGLGSVDNVSDANKPISTAMQSAFDNRDDILTSGESTLDRRLLSNSGIAISGSTLRLTYFTAKKSFTSTQGRMYTGTTAAGATPTLCRWGLFTIDGSGNGTLVASIANDTTLFAAATTAYLRSWSSSVAITAGQRYAWGVCVVTAAATPTFFGGASGQSIFGTIAAVAPRLTGSIGSSTDLPSSFTAGSVGTGANLIYAELLP